MPVRLAASTACVKREEIMLVQHSTNLPTTVERGTDSPGPGPQRHRVRRLLPPAWTVRNAAPEYTAHAGDANPTDQKKSKMDIRKKQESYQQIREVKAWTGQCVRQAEQARQLDSSMTQPVLRVPAAAE